METLYQANLSNKIICKCNAIKKRLWISSPFVGGEKSVLGILGNKIRTENNLDLKLIIDISSERNCDYLTLNTLKHYDFIIRTLNGLHAKIYIFDDECIITSANLTNKAFTKKHEIGVFLSKDESIKAIEIFEIYFKYATNIGKFSAKDINNQKRKRLNPGESSDYGSEAKPFFKIPEISPPSFIMPERERHSELNRVTETSRIWKISLGYRWRDIAIYDACIRYGKITIGWFEENNIGNWRHNRILNGLDGNTQNANSVYNFTHEINNGDLVLVYDNRTNVRAIGIVTGDYEYNRTLINGWPHLRDVIWLTYGRSIDIHRLNGNKNLSEKTLYPLYNINLNSLIDLLEEH